MSTLLFLLLGLTIATCVIAYWSDNLGKKLGKKRVTLFGLRPRQTATLMTMASSVVIMLFTFVALLLVNSGLRRALLHYDEVRAVNHKLSADNRLLREDQKTLKKKNEQARNATHEAMQQAKTARQAKESAERDYAAANARLHAEQARLITAQQMERNARAEANAARKSAAQATRQLGDKQQKLAQVGEQLKQADTRLRELKFKLAEAEKAKSTAEANATTARAKADAAYKSAFQQVQLLMQDVARQGEAVAQLQQQQQSLGKEITRLQLVKNQLEASELAVEAGWVFDARTIWPRTTASQAAAQLHDLVDKTAAVIADSEPKRTLRVVLSDGTSLVEPEEIIASLAKYLATFTVPVSVRLISTRNHALAETEIQTALVPVPGRLVIPRGQTLVSATIDGAQSDVKIFSQLYHLLESGEAVARKRGVNPFYREEKDEHFYYADTNERLFEALRRLQEAKAPRVVRLVTADDITVLDRLRVRFDIAAPGVVMRLLAFDPGRAKCGVAVVEQSGAIVARRVAPAADVQNLLRAWTREHHVSQLVIGDSTSSRQWQERIAAWLPDIKIIVVNERDSTLEARTLYWQLHPPRGWRRLLPLSLQTPPVPIDDCAAVVLARRWLDAQQNATS